jgi:hypothetical protein
MRPSASQAIRVQLIAAMETRAAGLDGEARRVLEERVAALRAIPANELPDTAADGSAWESATRPRRGPLGSLVDSIASDASAERAAYPELPALEDLRNLWSNIRADSQLQHSVAHTPVDAGPLNSAALVSRSIALMRELSPGYLRSFLAYVDDLAWLEQLGSASAATASGAAAIKKRARHKRGP